MKNAANNFKNAFNAYKSTADKLNAAENAFFADAENASKEEAYDAAYNEHFTAYANLVNVTVSICAPFVEGFTAKTARAMLAKNEAQIMSLVERFAA